MIVFLFGLFLSFRKIEKGDKDTRGAIATKMPKTETGDYHRKKKKMKRTTTCLNDMKPISCTKVIELKLK